MNGTGPKAQNPMLGIMLMLLAHVIFAVQDGFSRILGEHYPITLVVMIRYWAMILFALALVHWRFGGIRKILKTEHLLLQLGRGALLALEICVTVWAFVALGLTQSLAIFFGYPLLVAALSVPMLGERVGWRRWSAILVGFVGVLIMLNPARPQFSPELLIPVLGALMFAFYALLTRLAARYDSAETSLVYTALGGVLVMSVIGLPSWEMIALTHWPYMIALCVTGIVGHYLLIRALELAEPTLLQPFSYIQLVIGSMIGVWVFAEIIDGPMWIGSALVVLAGLFTIWRGRVRGG